MSEQKNLLRLLQLIGLLADDNGYDIKRLMRRFEVSDKTIYRNIKTLEQCGFNVFKDKKNRYYLKNVDNIYKGHNNISFDAEESALIKESVLSLHSSNPLKGPILEKLFAFSVLPPTSELIIESYKGQVIVKLLQAIQNERVVVLEKYHSLNSNTLKNRTVEPHCCVQNMEYLLAYDIESKKLKQFKISRVKDVEILSDTTNPDRKKTGDAPDCFGMNGTLFKKIILYP